MRNTDYLLLLTTLLDLYVLTTHGFIVICVSGRVVVVYDVSVSAYLARVEERKMS